MTRKDKRYMAALYGSTFLFIAFMGAQLSITTIRDELCTIINSTHLMGYDWSAYLGGANSLYFKYGMILIQYPVLLLINDPETAFRVLMVIHAALLALIPVIAYSILRFRLSTTARPIGETSAAMMALVCGLVPAAILHSLYARADVMMMLVPWTVLWLLLSCQKNVAEGDKPALVRNSILLSMAAVYAYMCHGRGVVVVIATVVTVLFFQIVARRRPVHWAAFGGSLCVMLVLDKVLTTYFRDNIWIHGVESNTLSTLDLSARLDLLTTFSGLSVMVKSICGWLFTIFAGTAGVTILGLLVAACFVLMFIRKKAGVANTEVIFSTFSALLLLGILAMGVIFFYESVYAQYHGQYPYRGDRLLYERYIAAGFGPLVLLGLYGVLHRPELVGFKIKMGTILVCAALLVVFAWKIGPVLNRQSVAQRHVISQNLFVPTQTTAGDQLIPNLGQLFTLNAAVGLCVFIGFLVLAGTSASEKRQWLALGGLICYFFVLTIGNYYRIRFVDNRFRSTRVQTAYHFLAENREVADDFPILALHEADPRSYQFLLMDFNSVPLDSDFMGSADEYFLITRNGNLDFLDDVDSCYAIKGYDYTAEDSVYVVGDTLKLYLEQKGYTLTALT